MRATRPISFFFLLIMILTLLATIYQGVNSNAIVDSNINESNSQERAYSVLSTLEASKLISQYTPVSNFDRDADLISLLTEKIKTKSMVYELVSTRRIPATSTVLYRYIGEGKYLIDVFQTTLTKEDGALGTTFLDNQVLEFLDALPLLVEKGIYKSAYPEISREIYVDINGRELSGRRVIARFVNEEGKLRSLYIILTLADNEYITFRHTILIQQFNENLIMEFIEGWLKIKITDASIAQNANPTESVITPDNTTSSIFPESEKEELRKELAKFDGEILANYHPGKNGEAVIEISDKYSEDEDLGVAIMFHELMHSGFDTEEEMNQQIAKISAEYYLTLTNEDFQIWGKNELVADLSTMDMLAKNGFTRALKKYVLIRGLPEDIYTPFIIKCLQVEK